MKTVLLWGARWWLPGRAEPVSGLGSESADALAAAWPEGDERTLRIVFHPEGFVSVPVKCPYGKRDTLALALGDEHPPLRQSECAWSFDPILPVAEEYSTMLHYESEPRLFAMVARLEALGFTVVSAIPLATWLQCVPAEWSESGAFAVIMAESAAGFGYAHAANGARTAPAWERANAPAAVVKFAREFLAQNAGAAVLLIGSDEETTGGLRALLDGNSPEALELVSLAYVLNHAVVVPRRHPAQLLRPKPIVTAARAVAVASVLFLAVAGAAVATYVRECFAVRRETAGRLTELTTLQHELTVLRANAAEVAQLRGILNTVQAHPPADVLLRELSGPMPLETVISRLRVDPRGFVIDGSLAPSAKPALLDPWLLRLGRDGCPWHLQNPTVSAGGAFEVRGEFTG